MKIIIAGSRSITDYNVVKWAMLESGYWQTWKREIEVVSGMALSWKWATDPTAGGVDRLGVEFALKNGLEFHPFHADWKKHGKAAGMIRNETMGDWTKAHGGRLLAIWDGESPGTLGMVAYAKKIGLEHIAYKRVTDQLYRRMESDE